MGELTSAELPPLGPGDHVRGDGPVAILYLDLGCPHCAAVWLEARELPLRLCVRHFPLAAKHPRAPALHAAAEAAAAQGETAFWALWNSIYEDRAHVDDPHLWARAQALGLDLFGEGLDDNWTVTAIRAPESADADAICDTIRAEHGCVLAPGQGPLKGKVFRIGHFGYFSELDIIRGLAALEMTLESLGHPVKRGAAVAAAETVFMESRGA